MRSAPTIALASGRLFDLARLNVEDVTIEDIAQGLANTCRFGGQCRRFYSVAEHSVLSSAIVPREHAYAALMHDCAEALIGDIPTPLKEILPDYQRLEHQVEQALFARFKVPLRLHDEVQKLHNEVKRADLAMLVRELDTLFPGWQKDKWIHTLASPAPIALRFDDPVTARASFLATYHILKPQGA